MNTEFIIKMRKGIKVMLLSGVFLTTLNSASVFADDTDNFYTSEEVSEFTESISNPLSWTTESDGGLESLATLLVHSGNRTPGYTSEDVLSELKQVEGIDKIGDEIVYDWSAIDKLSDESLIYESVEFPEDEKEMIKRVIENTENGLYTFVHVKGEDDAQYVYVDGVSDGDVYIIDYSENKRTLTELFDDDKDARFLISFKSENPQNSEVEFWSKSNPITKNTTLEQVSEVIYLPEAAPENIVDSSAQSGVEGVDTLDSGLGISKNNFEKFLDESLFSEEEVQEMRKSVRSSNDKEAINSLLEEKKKENEELEKEAEEKRIALKKQKEEEERRRAEEEAKRPAIPVKGNYRFTSPFGMRRHPVFKDMRQHNGVDLSAPVGTPILSTQSGTVVDTGYRSGAGNYVVIKHDKDQYYSEYFHLNSINVSNGQSVGKSQQIGTMGSTGVSTGSHLHFGISTGISSGYINPESYVKLR